MDQMRFRLQSLSRARSKDAAFLMVLLICSLALNVYLGWKVTALKMNRPRRSATLLPGTIVPSVVATSLNDQRETITYQGKDLATVLYIFSPGCSWCDRNLDNVRTLVTLKGESFRFIGLSLADAGLEEYIATRGLKFPIYKKPSPEAVRDLELGTTPQTIVISPEGKVLKNWLGAYSDGLKPEVDFFLTLSFPV